MYLKLISVYLKETFPLPLFLLNNAMTQTVWRILPKQSVKNNLLIVK